MKKILIILLGLVMIFSLVACGEKSDETNSEPAKNSTEDAFEYGTDYINSHLKGDYSISYKMTTFGSNEETDTSTITNTKTDEGYYLKLDENTEMLYIKNGDKYDMYMSSGDGNFEKVPDVLVSEEEVQTSTASFIGYMSTYTEFRDALNRDGSEKIAGRSCEKYALDSATIGAKYKAEYCIDKETGVCLKYAVEGKANGESGGYEFVCTEFNTSNVSLPKYK